jgi:hypothetical protein
MRVLPRIILGMQAHSYSHKFHLAPNNNGRGRTTIFAPRSRFSLLLSGAVAKSPIDYSVKLRSAMVHGSSGFPPTSLLVLIPSEHNGRRVVGYQAHLGTGPVKTVAYR